MAPLRLSPGQLPWCHPRRLLADAAAIGLLLVLACVYAGHVITTVVSQSLASVRSSPRRGVLGTARALLSCGPSLFTSVWRRLGSADDDDDDGSPLSSGQRRQPQQNQQQRESTEEEEEEEEEGGEGWIPASDVLRGGVRGTVTLPVQATGWPAGPRKRESEREEGEGKGVRGAEEADSPTFELYFESYPATEQAEPTSAGAGSAGGGTPTAVLVNPTGGSAAAWRLSGAVAHLQHRGYHVLLCDLRGQGRTGWGPPLSGVVAS